MKGLYTMNTRNYYISAFFAMLKENTVKALSLSEMTAVSFPPYEETGKSLEEETATVTFRLPDFITTQSGESEINLLFDFGKLTALKTEKGGTA